MNTDRPAKKTRTTRWSMEEGLVIARALLKHYEETGERLTYSDVVRIGVRTWTTARGVPWPADTQEPT